MTPKEIFRVTNLSVSLIESNRMILDSINFHCCTGEIFMILGKNGSGKSTLALSLTRLLPNDAFKISGNVYLKEKNIFQLFEHELNLMRQKNISYILQNPFSAFDPIQKIRKQFEYLSRLKQIPLDTFQDLMIQLGLKEIDLILNKYPFELSGGMLQRLSIVNALASSPELIIADEPTSALDRPITLHLMDFLSDYLRQNNSCLIFITQDITLAESYADRIALIENKKLSKIQNKDDFFRNYQSNEQKMLVDSYRYLKL